MASVVWDQPEGSLWWHSEASMDKKKLGRSTRLLLAAPAQSCLLVMVPTAHWGDWDNFPCTLTCCAEPWWWKHDCDDQQLWGTWYPAVTPGSSTALQTRATAGWGTPGKACEREAATVQKVFCPSITPNSSSRKIKGCLFAVMCNVMLCLSS